MKVMVVMSCAEAGTARDTLESATAATRYKDLFMEAPTFKAVDKITGKAFGRSFTRAAIKEFRLAVTEKTQDPRKRVWV